MTGHHFRPRPFSALLTAIPCHGRKVNEVLPDSALCFPPYLTRRLHGVPCARPYWQDRHLDRHAPCRFRPSTCVFTLPGIFSYPITEPFLPYPSGLKFIVTFYKTWLWLWIHIQLPGFSTAANFLKLSFQESVC